MLALGIFPNLLLQYLNPAIQKINLLVQGI
jgi:hypothetical protein